MVQNPSRRLFFKEIAAVGAAASSPLPIEGTGAGAVIPQPVAIPTVDFHGTRITRLVIGSNPLYGYSHFNSILDRTMRDWMTGENRVQTLHRAEAAGINTWQVHYNDPTIDDLKRYRDEGGKMNWLLLGDFAMMTDWKLIKEMAKLKPLGIAHHGNRTDNRFRDGEMHIVQDFVKAVQDAGLPGGVSMHNPQVMAYIEEKGWKVDYYMTCLFHVSRTREEARAEFGEAPLGETFMEGDPARMTAMVRKTSKPCFAFKILGAGRAIGSGKAIDGAFEYAYTNIKPNDAVIVGMFPKYKDEMRENAERVARLLGGGAAQT
ncbi:MAG: hypothetical protein IT169_06225 [Bryobacterales bacterium]|nr:hypothetical protein [Bryobacterales bacterium]